jgi:hypothetical protein
LRDARDRGVVHNPILCRYPDVDYRAVRFGRVNRWVSTRVVRRVCRVGESRIAPLAVEETERRRRLNENRMRLFGSNAERTIVFVCECENEGCRETVLLKAGDYDSCAERGELVLHGRHAPTAN